MTEEMKVALEAINKFMFYSWNYTLIEHEWVTTDGTIHKEVVPEFLVKVPWHCDFQHMLNKWREAISTDNPMIYFPEFYKRLDTQNTQVFLEWIMKNYNGERKLNLK